MQQLPSLNLTLKEGETITVDIKTNSTGRTSFGSYYFFLFRIFRLILIILDSCDDDDGDSFLPPPPSGNKKISAMSTKSRNSPQKQKQAQPSRTGMKRNFKILLYLLNFLHL